MPGGLSGTSRRVVKVYPRNPGSLACFSDKGFPPPNPDARAVAQKDKDTELYRGSAYAFSVARKARAGRGLHLGFGIEGFRISP